MLGRAQHLHYDFDHFYVVCFVNSPQKIEVRKIRVFQAFASISKQFQIIHFFHFYGNWLGNHMDTKKNILQHLRLQKNITDLVHTVFGLMITIPFNNLFLYI